MPRSSRAAAARTRESIVREVVDEASVAGLDGVTIGSLAERLRMSKAGIVGPFGSKEKLQLEALARAAATFREEVWETAAPSPPGRARLEIVVEAWLAHLARPTFPGGCFLTQAAADFDARPGAVRDAIREIDKRWRRTIAGEVEAALARGELAGVDPAQAAFEVNAIAQGVNQAIQLHDDPGAVARGRAAMRRALGLDG
ncbi:MAG TPA: TetR/AcrR family transcriptional regulator [Solirubrobacterales bacterium]|nr:TetR/AcrR family transcriptional regulator [Solirubrobacterales bacterium]